MKKRIGFGPNAFRKINKPLRKMKRLNEDVYDNKDFIVYFESEEHLNILTN